METLVIGIMLVVLFVITWIVIGCNGCSHDIQMPPSTIGSYRSFEQERDRQKIVSLELELDYVRRSCRLHHQPPFLGCDGCHHTTKYLAQTVKQQELVDLVKKISAPLGKLEEKLGVSN